MKLWCVLFVTVVLMNTVAGDKLLKIVQFLMNNQELCGKPFSDAEWIPVLDMCEENCNEMSEICVENDQLIQKCNKLPKECTKALEMFINPRKVISQSRWNSIPRIQERQKQWESNLQRQRVASRVA